ncbi:MAG: ABC transporter substrate-binding protein, partial [Ruminococcaceae bacterium]|nr:ABC transporter substrate-binding protein [Oscillospiraceae bacterium]
MKKFLALAIVAVMLIAFAGCGNQAGNQNSAKEPDAGAAKEKIAYVLCETGDTYSQGLGTYFKDAFEKAGGKVIFESFPKDTADFTSYLLKATQEKAAVIFAPNSTEVAGFLLTQAADKGIEIPILAGDTWESSVILNNVKGTDSVVYCSTFFDENDKSGPAAAFVSGFKAWLKEDNVRLTNNGGNDIVAAVSALGFDTYNTAYAAIEKALAEKGDKLTSVDVATALWGLDIKDAVTGSIKFNKNGDAIKDSAYIKRAGQEGFEFVKVQTVANEDEQGKAAEYKSAGIALEGNKINVGVYQPLSGKNGAGGKQELLGIQYAHSLKPTIKVGDTEYEVVLDVQDNGS